MIGNMFLLDGWAVDVSSGRISRGDEYVRLEPQVMKVLAYLAKYPGIVVTREELFNKLWGHSFVGDAALTRCIFEIRRAFGDNPRNPKIVETVPKIGFRLVANPTLPKTRSEFISPTLLWAGAATLLLTVFLLLPGLHNIGDGTTIANQSASDKTYNKAIAHLARRTRVSNENAIATFRKIITSDPDSGLAHAGLANAISQQLMYWGGEQISDAYAAAETAMRLAPNAPESLNALGLVQNIQGDQSAALVSFNTAIQLDPDFVDATYNSADIYRRRQEFRKAVDLYSDVVQRAPDHLVAMSHLGFLYLRMGNLDDARMWIERVIDDTPMASYANSQLATLEMVTGNTATAVAVCEKVHELYPKHKACLHILGNGNLKLGNHEEALRWFNYEIQTFEDSNYAQLGVAQVLFATDQDNQGLAIVDDVLLRTNEFINRSDANWDDFWVLAACFALKGDADNALHLLEKAANAGRRFHLWDAGDPVFVALHGDQRFDQYISMTMSY